MSGIEAPYRYSEQYVMYELKLEVPATVTIGGTHYHAKTEYHCSLVAVKRLIPQLVELAAISDTEAEARIVTAVTEVLSDTKPGNMSFTGQYRIASKPDDQKQTIVGLVSVDKLQELFTALGQKLELDLALPTPHVTLYTLENGLPIGLTNQSELDAWSRPLTAAEQAEWASQVGPLQLEAHQ